MPTNVKIFGERHSGTNLLAQLLEENTSCRLFPGSALERQDTHGRISRMLVRVPALRELHAEYLLGNPEPRFAWKHAATHFRDPENLLGVVTLFLVKHPLSWLVSMARRPHQFFGQVPSNPSALADVPIPTRRRELLGRVSLTPLEIWQNKARSYLSLASELEARNQRVVFVSFEKLVANQVETLLSLKDVLGHVTPEPRAIEVSTKGSNLNHTDYARYYQEEHWRSSFEAREISRLLGRIDENLLQRFHYAIE